jgi:DNA-binding NarL/FixJ family response regulator
MNDKQLADEIALELAGDERANFDLACSRSEWEQIIAALRRGAEGMVLTSDEASEAARAIRTVMNPAGGIYIHKSWNVILRKLDMLSAAEAEGRNSGTKRD